MYPVWDKSYTIELDRISEKCGYESKKMVKKTTKVDELQSHGTLASYVSRKKRRASPEVDTQKKSPWLVHNIFDSGATIQQQSPTTRSKLEVKALQKIA